MEWGPVAPQKPLGLPGARLGTTEALRLVGSVTEDSHPPVNDKLFWVTFDC